MSVKLDKIRPHDGHGISADGYAKIISRGGRRLYQSYVQPFQPRTRGVISTRSMVCAKGVRFSAKRRGRRRHQNLILESLGYDSYTEYLEGAAWKAIRTAKLAVNPNCEICSKSAQAVHHMAYDYDTLTGRSAKGLVSVCNQCHRDIEFTSSGRKRPFKVTRNITERLLRQAGRLAEHLQNTDA